MTSRNLWLAVLSIWLSFSVGYSEENATTVLIVSTSLTTSPSTVTTVTTPTTSRVTIPPIHDADRVCAVECGHGGQGCDQCDNTTFACPSKKLTAVCLSHLTPNTTDINLTNNMITSFRSFTGTYPSVTQLKLSNNKLTKLTKEDLAKFPRLRTLDLSHNDFTTLMEDVFEALPDLGELNLNSVGVYKLPDNIFKQNKNLHFVHLQGNKFPEFPREIFKPVWQRMTSLVISDNPISDIVAADLKFLTNLEHLDMERLEIVKIDPHTFAELGKLREISLEHNTKLVFIHEDAFGMASGRPGQTTAMLEKASIRACGLSSMDEHVFNLKGMKELGLSGNPWQCDCTIKWMVARQTFASSVGKNKIKDELERTMCQDIAHRGIVISAIPEDHFVCIDPRHRESSRFANGMGGATTVLVITFLLCIISIIFAVFMFQRRGRAIQQKNQTPANVNQYRAIYNQGNIQTHDEGFVVDRDKDPFSI